MAQLVEFLRPWTSPTGVRYKEGRQTVAGNYKPHPDFGKRGHARKGLPNGADPSAYLPSTARLIGKVKDREPEVEEVVENPDDWMASAGGVSVSGPNKTGWYTLTVEGEDDPEKVQGEAKAKARAEELRG